LGNYLLYEKHPIVLVRLPLTILSRTNTLPHLLTTNPRQYFFLGLVTASAAIFLPPTWPYITTLQKLLVFLLLPCPYLFTYLCQLSAPSSAHLISHVTNAHHLAHYPFDHILYHPGNICRTCELPKPARSKHCSLCKTCVARSDHHCIWVNNCVGLGNYKWFLILLLTTSLLLFYASYLAYVTLAPEVRWHYENYPEWHKGSFDSTTGWVGRFMGRLEAWADALSTAFMVGGLGRGGVGLLASLTAFLPLGLLGYHVYLIWAGMTTNETGKWADWKDDMNDGLVFMADMKPEHVYGISPQEDDNTPSHNPNFSHEVHKGKVDEFVWPVRSRQFLVRTRDGQMPREVHPSIQELIVDGTWRRVWHLNDVENIYDGGWWNNLAEVLRY
jgi:hypothetical protein